MLELLTAFTVKDIVFFLTLLFVAIKELFDVIDFFKGKESQWFNLRKKKEQNEISLSELSKKIDKIIEQVDVLYASDRDDIKSWLVEKYNFYKENPTYPISIHTMDTIEKRYSHYKEEGGNSYIDNTIMPGLREMAKEENRVKN